MGLDLSSKEASLELGYEEINENDIGIHKIFLSYPNPPILIINRFLNHRDYNHLTWLHTSLELVILT